MNGAENGNLRYWKREIPIPANTPPNLIIVRLSAQFNPASTPLLPNRYAQTWIKAPTWTLETIGVIRAELKTPNDDLLTFNSILSLPEATSYPTFISQNQQQSDTGFIF